MTDFDADMGGDMGSSEPAEAPEIEQNHSEDDGDNDAAFRAAMDKIKAAKAKAEATTIAPPKPKAPKPAPQDEDFDEAAEVEDPSDEDEDPSAEKPAPPPTFKIKVNGVEREVSYEEATRRLQMESAADEKFEQAANQRRQAEAVIKALKTDPFSVLERLGVGRDQVEKYMYEKYIAPDLMSEEERTEMAREKEYQELKSQKEAAEKQAAEARLEQQKEAYRQAWTQKLTTAIEGAKLPKSEWVVTRMANYMQRAIKNGYKDIEPADVTHLVRADLQKIQSETFAGMSEDELLEALGPEVSEKARKAMIKKFKPQAPAFAKGRGREATSSKASGPRIYRSASDLIHRR